MWLLGWLALPCSRRIFPLLPDGGLAAGRVLSLLLFALLEFELASFHLLDLRWTRALVAASIFLSLAIFYRTTKPPPAQVEFLRWLSSRRRALLASDLVFIGTFLFFVSMRLCRPEINDLEKPMDCAIIGTLAHTHYLPAQNPWFAGTLFTNYYYFGHFMGALLKRTFDTPLPYAYNLIQPAFCAFFVSTLWSLLAALCKSLRRGAGAVFMVAFCGNFEPLRQMIARFPVAGWKAFVPSGLDWWSTSRVIPGTINEYPFFTMAIGDAHAHFFALSISALILCLCHALIGGKSARGTETESAEPERAASSIVTGIFAGCVLASLAMTNTWDAPIYAALILVSLLGTVWYRPEYSTTQEKTQCLSQASILNIMWVKSFQICSPFLIVLPLASPFFRSYHPPIGGLKAEFWPFAPQYFLWIWGGFLTLWWLHLKPHIGRLQADGALRSTPAQHFLGSWGRRVWFLELFLLLMAFRFSSMLPLALALLCGQTMAQFIIAAQQDRTASVQQCDGYVYLMAGCGLIALVFPCFFYLQGFFGGALRHQDTVFKFGLQAWVLLGSAAWCALIRRFSVSTMSSRRFTNAQNWPAQIMAVLWIVPTLCSFVAWRARVETPLTQLGGAARHPLSLNAAREYSRAEQNAIFWLADLDDERACVVEAVGRDRSGTFVQAYSEFGRISSLTGIPSYIGWPQHAGFWGAPYPLIAHRLLCVEALYNSDSPIQIQQLSRLIMRDAAIPSSFTERRSTHLYLFRGALENHVYPNATGPYLQAGYAQSRCCQTGANTQAAQTEDLAVLLQGDFLKLWLFITRRFVSRETGT